MRLFLNFVLRRRAQGSEMAWHLSGHKRLPWILVENRSEFPTWNHKYWA